MRARYMDPGTGTFVSEDPAKNGINWFGYCSGNPVNLVDQNGKAIIAVIGLAILFWGGYTLGFDGGLNMLGVDISKLGWQYYAGSAVGVALAAVASYLVSEYYISVFFEAAKDVTTGAFFAAGAAVTFFGAIAIVGLVGAYILASFQHDAATQVAYALTFEE